MVENRIISYTDIAYVLGMSPKKLNRWYKEVLSGFTQAKEKREINKNDYKPKRSPRTNRVSKTIRVPIVLMENYGKEIAIDEKHIRGRFHTIISNIKTGKIILMARSMKSKELHNIVCKHFSIQQRMEVRVVTKDGSETYDWLSRQAFPNAIKVLDKFHVLKWVFDALNSYRNNLKTNYILDQANKQRILDIQYYNDKKKAKREGYSINRKSYRLEKIIHSNGDDTKQLLTRSRYLLYKYQDQWNTNQTRRADILSSEYPDLMDLYVLVLEFRDWYSKINIGASRLKQQDHLLLWIDNIRKFKSPVLNALATSIKKHRGQILNYFIKGYSNASAEALNRNIKKFIGVNYGIRNLDFFYFRLMILHSSTSK